MNVPILSAHNVHRTYPVTPPVHALHGVSFQVNAGERVAIVGSSGSGKSTFLNIVGLIDRPTTGTVTVLGRDTTTMTARDLDQVRADHLGFVFQENHILGHRTVEENLHIKLAVSTLPPASWHNHITRVLTSVGLTHRRTSLGRLLSGGEKQRLAVARAVITNPELLLADEPTGNLDTVNAENVLALFDQQAAQGVAVVVITHDLRLAQWADRTLTLAHGVLSDTTATFHASR